MATKEWKLTGDDVERLMRGLDKVVDEVCGDDMDKRSEFWGILMLQVQHIGCDEYTQKKPVRFASYLKPKEQS